MAPLWRRFLQKSTRPMLQARELSPLAFRILRALAPLLFVPSLAAIVTRLNRFCVAGRRQVRAFNKDLGPVDEVQNTLANTLKRSQASSHAIRHSSGVLWIRRQRPGPETTV